MSGEATVPAATLAREHDFTAPGWLANCHVQSVYPSLPLRRPTVSLGCRRLIRASRDVVVDCGDGVRLLASHATQPDGAPGAGRIAVLLHGWEGSSDSLYVLSLGEHLYEHGYDVVRLNLRDHGGSQGLNPGIFHSCRIAEVVGAVRSIQQSNPGRRLHLAGFSLGGNFMLRVAARARAAGIEPACVVAVCPVVDPEHTLVRLEQGWPVYRHYFVWKWRRSLRAKQQAWPDRYDLRDVLSNGTLTTMTDVLACRYGGYPSLQDYLRGYALTGDALATIEHPTRIITASDDPIIPVEDFARIARPRALMVTTTTNGGHCGYYDARSGASWIEREVLATFAAS
ncbi:MAG: alpha/beta fold hydrolase [Steroidobacteraceae bacterium]